MSRLSVYWPDECNAATTVRKGVARILSLPKRMPSEFPSSQDVVSRARLLFSNRRCPRCGYPVVQPLEEDDAMYNSSGLEIPGTATLIGFRCQSCEAEWYLP